MIAGWVPKNPRNVSSIQHSPASTLVYLSPRPTPHSLPPLTTTHKGTSGESRLASGCEAWTAGNVLVGEDTLEVAAGLAMSPQHPFHTVPPQLPSCLSQPIPYQPRNPQQIMTRRPMAGEDVVGAGLVGKGIVLEKSKIWKV